MVDVKRPFLCRESLNGQAKSGLLVTVMGLSVPASVHYSHTDITVHTSPMTAAPRTVLQGALPCLQEGPLLFGNCNQDGGRRPHPENAVSQLVSSRSASANVGHVQNQNQVVRHPGGQEYGLQAERQAAVPAPPNPEEVGQEAARTCPPEGPQHDLERGKKPEWIILIGVCTHLGCVPIAHAGDFSGYYCPCLGPHYDASGRTRTGPVPLYLKAPHCEFTRTT